MDAMEKKMTTELEKAIQEIERLRQENAQLRKKLGTKVSEPKSHYNQSGPSSVGPDTSFEETQEIPDLRWTWDTDVRLQTGWR